MATAILSAGLQTIPLDQITENPFNPRKHFDKASLNELAESIKVHGVRQPVLVRPKDKGFQLVVGARRFRASKLAGKADIPAIVDPELDDRSALEIMVIENLQREDVHPLDEAMGYQVLMEQRCLQCNADPGFHKRECPKSGTAVEEVTVEVIAQKVGKSVGYVYARLKLLALVASARECLQAGHISAGHSVLIARLQPFDQLKALAACFKSYITKDEEARLKKLDAKAVKWEEFVDVLALPPDTGKEADEEDFVTLGPSDSLRVASEKYLREWIQDNVNLRLKDVPWDLADAKLYPAAGACATCEKRSASNPALFAELAVKGEDTCFDAACYGKKREAFVKLTIKEDKKRIDEATSFPGVDPGEKQIERIRQISEQTAYTRPNPDQRVLKQGQWLPAKKKDECASVEEALIVNGENAGVKKLVCCNGACKVHKHHFQTAVSAHGGDQARKADPEARAKEEAKEKIDELMIQHVLSTLAAKITKPQLPVIDDIAQRLLENFYGDMSVVASALGLKFKEGDEGDAVHSFRKKADYNGLAKLAWLLVVADDIVAWAPEFNKLAERGGIDVKKLRKELEAKELKSAPVQTSAKPAPKKAAKKGKAKKGK